MAMNPACIARLAQAAGKPLTQAQLDNIEGRLRKTATMLARQDVAKWQAMSPDQRTLAAAQQAVADIQAEAALKVQRAQLQVLKTAATEQRISDQLPRAGGSRSRALVRDLDQTETVVRGEQRLMMSGLLDAIEAAHSKDGTTLGRKALMFLFDAENPGMTRDFAREIFGQANGSTGNALAQKAAKAWLDTIEAARQRFNAAGGDVGRLDYGYLPQPHDQIAIRLAGADAWADKVLPLLDRGRYLKEDGSRMADAEVRDFLLKAHETLASGGANKVQPGQFRGDGMRANKGSHGREIHFKDGDSYLAYLSEFGNGGMYDAITGHISRLARDTVLIERYGPNANAQMRLQMDLAERADGELQRTFGMRPESYWAVVSGTADSADSARLAQVALGLRNIQVAAKLGGAVISSVTDIGTYFATTGYNRLPYWQAIKNIAKANTAESRAWLNAHGMMAESLISDLHRWSGDHIRNGITGKLANATMKLSLMNAWTDSLRRAFQLTMMQGLARMKATDWANLSEFDRARLGAHGITDADWAVIQKAQTQQVGGADALAADAVTDVEVRGKLQALILDESEMAIINPDLATRAMTSGGGMQRGTVRGELARSVMQFKSFPIAMISRHWGRVLEGTGSLPGAPLAANPLAYASALAVTLTALGAIAYQTKQVIAGKDPVNMTGENAGKFWLRAFVQGGGAGIAGDFLLTDPGEQPGGAMSGALKNLAGPSIGAVGELGLEVGLTNIWQAARDRPTHAGAEAVRWARGNTPMINLWYARAAFDHAGLHALQENLSPGYLAKMKRRAQRDWGQDYWWQPGTGLPERAPDLGAAVGR